MLWIGANIGAMAVVVFFSLCIASVYQDRALRWHAVASSMGIAVTFEMVSEAAMPFRAATLLLLSLATAQLRDLVAHLQDGGAIRRRLRHLAIAMLGLAVLALCAQFSDAVLALGILAWSLSVWAELRSARGGCRPWLRIAILGYAALIAAVVVILLRGKLGAAPASMMLAIWSCNLYLATVWRHRRLSDRQLTLAHNRFVSMLGHDLRSPLQAIALSAAVLETSNDVSSIGERIRSTTRRMERMIMDVLDLSRLQNGSGLAVRRRTVDIVAIIAGIIEDFRARGAEILFISPPGAAVLADGDRIAQLIENLLSNAWHHGELGFPLRLQVAASGRRVSVRVSNRGAPIPEELRPQLFSPFKPASVGNVRNPGGLGLGLYIAREIVRAHGGSLGYEWVAPDVVFTVTLPAAG